MFFFLICHQRTYVQLIQNSAARLVSLTKKRDHITPVLHDLHWLTIQKGIMFKPLLLTYKVVNSMVPDYLCELIKLYTRPRSLLSSSKDLLQVKSYCTKTYGARAFSNIAPRLWNYITSAKVRLSIFSKLLSRFICF